MEHPMTPDQQNESNWIQHSIAGIMRKLDAIDRAITGNRKDVEAKIDKTETRLMMEMKERFKEVVHKHEFDPVKRIVYGLVGLLLMGVGAAALKLVLQSGAVG